MIEVKDHGYVTQQGVSLYSAIHNDVLAVDQTIGSPINTALAPQLEKDHMVNFPAAWAQSLTENKENAIVGATYEIEMINVLDYLLEQGKIKEGDTIGHIYFEGEYGEGGLAGSKYFASKHGMTVAEAQIEPTDTDMTASITKLKSKGVDAIALTVAPGQTASAAGVASSQGLDVPIAGNNPVFAPALLDGPAGPALKKNLYVASPMAPFDKPPTCSRPTRPPTRATRPWASSSAPPRRRDAQDPGQGLQGRRPHARGGQQGQGGPRRGRHRRHGRAAEVQAGRVAERRATSSGRPTSPVARRPCPTSTPATTSKFRQGELT